MSVQQPVASARLQLTGWERFWYVLGNILTLGVPYILKIQRKIALIEVLNQRAAAAQFAAFEEYRFRQAARDERDEP